MEFLVAPNTLIATVTSTRVPIFGLAGPRSDAFARNGSVLPLMGTEVESAPEAVSNNGKARTIRMRTAVTWL